MPGNQDLLDLAKRAAALGFSAVYLHTHKSERASALRVAYLAYRFLNGDDVQQINADADHDNASREATARTKKSLVVEQTRVTRIFHIRERKTNGQPHSAEVP